MNKGKIRRILYISLMIMILVFNGIGFSLAASSSELQQQQKELDKQIEKTKSEIKEVKEDLSDALTQIKKLNAEISGYENEISDLNDRINTLNTEIANKEINIKEQEEKYAIQKDLLDKRLVALYESGSSSYLDFLLSSDGLSDFISKYYIISTIAESDEALLQKIDDTKKQIEEEKVALESAKVEVQTSKTAIEGKRNSLAASKTTKKNLVSNLSETEKGLNAQLEEFEEDKRQIQSELAAIASKYKGVAVAPSAAGYTCPIPGKTKANITTGYYGYPGHTGADFACSSGTPIVAVKAGTVVTSKALKRSNGTYKSYGEYIVIDHHDGTMTLYAHMYPGSRLVSSGASVSQGQQIGSVGTTGNSSGNHLHFEVRVKGKCTNPTPYLP